MTGLDISERLLDIYKKKYPDCEARCESVFDTTLQENSFDCVFVTGGLHHLHPRVLDAVDQIYKILKPGGCFSFFEP